MKPNFSKWFNLKEIVGIENFTPGFGDVIPPKAHSDNKGKSYSEETRESADQVTHLGASVSNENTSATTSGDSSPSENPKSENPLKRKVLYSWEAPSKEPSSGKTNARLNRSLVIIAIVVALLLVAMQEFLLILAIASVVFIKYALEATPTETVTNEITNQGFNYAGTLYEWEELEKFYIKPKENYSVLGVVMRKSFPNLLMTFVPHHQVDAVAEHIHQYLPMLKQAPQDSMEMAYDRLKSKFTITE